MCFPLLLSSDKISGLTNMLYFIFFISINPSHYIISYVGLTFVFLFLVPDYLHVLDLLGNREKNGRKPFPSVVMVIEYIPTALRKTYTAHY